MIGVTKTSPLPPQVLAALVSHLRANTTSKAAVVFEAAVCTVPCEELRPAFSKELADTSNMSEEELRWAIAAVRQGSVHTAPVMMVKSDEHELAELKSSSTGPGICVGGWVTAGAEPDLCEYDGGRP